MPKTKTSIEPSMESKRAPPKTEEDNRQITKFKQKREGVDMPRGLDHMRT